MLIISNIAANTTRAFIRDTSNGLREFFCSLYFQTRRERQSRPWRHRAAG